MVVEPRPRPAALSSFWAWSRSDGRGV